MSKQIDLKKVFSSLKDEQYVIIKKSLYFPEYHKGDDIDIFAYSIDKVSEKILFILKSLIWDGINIKIKRKEDNGIYIDVFDNGELEIRFDLYQKLPKYKNLLIKDALFSSIIENAIIKNDFKFPNEIDEMILRYIEYQEWYAKRPDKIKHIEYVKEYLNNDNKKYFFDKLHYYTALPPLEYKVVKHSVIRGGVKYLFNRFLILRNAIKSYGYKETLNKIIKRVFK